MNICTAEVTYRSMAICFKVNPNVKVHSLMMEVFDASGNTDHVYVLTETNSSWAQIKNPPKNMNICAMYVKLLQFLAQTFT